MSEINNPFQPQDLPEKPEKKDRPAPLSDSEKSFILNNYLKMSDKVIAKTLGRHHLTIQKYRLDNRLKKDDKVSKKQVVAESEVFRSKIDNANSDEKKELYKKQLLSSSRVHRLKKTYSPEDLQFFIDKWADYHVQLKDLTTTEEDMLEKMIIIDIRLGHNQKAIFDLRKVQEDLQGDLAHKGELDPENDKDLQILQTIQTYNGQEVELNKQFSLLFKEYQEIHKSLNVTREQREHQQKIGATTFMDLIKFMNDKEYKEKAGREAELAKIAAERKRATLSKPHKYLDGSVDIPLLTTETFEAATRTEDEKT